jgi:hypothetical protein
MLKTYKNHITGLLGLLKKTSLLLLFYTNCQSCSEIYNKLYLYLCRNRDAIHNVEEGFIKYFILGNSFNQF